MPSPGDAVDVPRAATAVARRYIRVERPVSGALALVVALVFVAAYLVLPLLQALVAWVVLLAAVRAPAFRSHGTARLATDADPEAVHAEFAGPTPPVLALQWGIADRVRRTDEGAVYEISYLFGLRSTTVETAVRQRPSSDEEAGEGVGGNAAGASDGSAGDAASGDLELAVTAGGTPWATYVASVSERADRTVVDVEMNSDRRFGLRRLPQWLVAERYRQEALEAQGYEVLNRDAGLSL